MESLAVFKPRWTPEMDADLERLWESGASATQIAAQIGGVTKNAVLSRVRRIGLLARPSPIANEANGSKAKWGHLFGEIREMRQEGASPAIISEKLGIPENPLRTIIRKLGLQNRHGFKTVIRRKPAPLPVKIDAAPVYAEPLNGVGVNFDTLKRSQCAMPLWAHEDRPSFLYCGQPVARGSYCERCARVAYKGVWQPAAQQEAPAV